MPIQLPTLKRLEVHNYQLYPGSDERPGLVHDFSDGISLIVGTNGLGKTTLINIILRCLIGPYNPPRNDGVVLSSRQEETAWRERKAFFSKRVRDQAINASALLEFAIGGKEFRVVRSLRDVRLLSLMIGGDVVGLEKPNASLDANMGERRFRTEFTTAMGASSFVAALQIVRQLVFVDETRRALLWDTQSQTAILRDLLIGAESAGHLRDVESKFLSADSRERNLRWQTNNLALRMNSVRSALENSAPISDRLAIVLETIRADEDRRYDLEQSLADAEQEVRRLRLSCEQTRLRTADARANVDELRLTRAARLFPDLDATGRYILSRFYEGDTCKACGATVASHLQHLDELVRAGHCLVCSSPPEKQQTSLGLPTVAARSELVDADFNAKRQMLENLSVQLAELERSLSEAEEEMRSATDSLTELVNGLSAAKSEARALSARLPPDDTIMRKLVEEHEISNRQVVEATASRKLLSEEYKQLLTELREATSARQEEIVRAFSAYVRDFLSEDASLSYAPRQQKLGQSGDRFELPRFRFEMTSAAYEGRVSRDGVDDVSESQREFIDLAYRMALIDTCVVGPATLIMETPEASLDGVFMQQAGIMLNSYGARKDRQLIVTSNLSNAGMIKALMKDGRDMAEHKVINLFALASPTRAVVKFGEQYQQLLLDALGGSQAA